MMYLGALCIFVHVRTHVYVKMCLSVKEKHTVTEAMQFMLIIHSPLHAFKAKRSMINYKA